MFKLTAGARLFLAGSLMLSLSSPALAARITKANSKQVIIDTEGDDIQVGDEFYALVNEKKKAKIRIDKVSKSGARGKIVQKVKGKVDLVDASLEPTKGKARAADRDSESADPDTASDVEENLKSSKSRDKSRRSAKAGSSTTFVGVLGGFSLDSQSISGTANASMSGTGYSVKGFADIPLSSSLGVIGRGGVEQLNFSGTAGSKSVNTSLLYATADLLMRWNFSTSTWRPFVAGGLGLHAPVSKSSNILDESGISATTVFFASVGTHYILSSDKMLTFYGEYGLFPPSSSVSTNFMALRVGYGWRW